MRNRLVLVVVVLGLLVCVAAIALGRRDHSPMAADESYPYHSKQFTAFIADSYNYTKSGEPAAFYRWMDKAYRASGMRVPGQSEPDLQKALAAEKKAMEAITDPDARAKREIALGSWVHKMVKTTIPKFSLTRGFEFAYVVKYGERQCFLQSTLIAALLQSAGMDAGVAMVYCNTEGVQINLGHCVTLVQLANGQDRIIDASHDGAYVKDQGLLVRTTDYEFVDPVYGLGGKTIKQFTSVKTHRVVPNAQVRGLDISYLQSMFWYYRGERAPGGILAKSPTAKGLALSEAAYVKSHAACAANPLTTYMLGRTYLSEHKIPLAKQSLEQAYSDYRRYGWIPAGPKEYLAAVEKVAPGGKHG